MNASRLEPGSGCVPVAGLLRAGTPVAPRLGCVHDGGKRSRCRRNKNSQPKSSSGSGACATRDVRRGALECAGLESYAARKVVCVCLTAPSQLARLTAARYLNWSPSRPSAASSSPAWRGPQMSCTRRHCGRVRGKAPSRHRIAGGPAHRRTTSTTASTLRDSFRARTPRPRCRAPPPRPPSGRASPI